MSNNPNSSRTDTVIKLALVFFISLLSFSVGTFVGKKFSDGNHKLASLENEMAKEDAHGERAAASVPSDVLEVVPDEVLTKEKVQKMGDEVAHNGGHESEEAAELIAPKGKNSKEHKESKSEESNHHSAKNEKVEKTEAAEKHVAAAKNEHEKVETTAKAAHSKTEASVKEQQVVEHKVHDQLKVVQKEAERIAQGHEPSIKVENKVEKRQPSSLPVVSSDTKGKFTIQVSSHQAEADAKKQAEQLKGKGFSAFYIPAKVKDSTWYRVSVGLFATKKEATEYMATLKKDSGISSAIIQQITQ